MTKTESALFNSLKKRFVADFIQNNLYLKKKNILVSDFLSKNFTFKNFGKALKKRFSVSNFFKICKKNIFYSISKKKNIRVHLINNPARPKTAGGRYMVADSWFNNGVHFSKNKHFCRVYLNNPYIILKMQRFNNEGYLSKLKPKYLTIIRGTSRGGDIKETKAQQKIHYSSLYLNKTRLERSSRLIRVTNVLVLPSNILMATITNSFDVVHS